MTPLSSYIVHSALQTGFGLAIGFVAGRLWGNFQRPASSGGVVDDMSAQKSWRARISPHVLLGVVVVCLGLGTAAQGLYQDSQTRKVAECTKAYSDGFADALEQRATASSAAQNALDTLMTRIGELTAGGQAGTAQARAEFRQALDEYLRSRAEAKKQQVENPFPPPPRDICK